MTNQPTETDNIPVKARTKKTRRRKWICSPEQTSARKRRSLDRRIAANKERNQHVDNLPDSFLFN